MLLFILMIAGFCAAPFVVTGVGIWLYGNYGLEWDDDFEEDEPV